MSAATFQRNRCPREGCTQLTEVVLDDRGSIDRDYRRCLWHGEVFVGQVPDIDEPGEVGRKRGVPSRRGVRL